MSVGESDGQRIVDEFPEVPPKDQPIDIHSDGQLLANLQGISAARKVIHNRYYKISGCKYWVEISFSKPDAYIILRPAESTHGKIKAPKYLTKVVPLKIADKLLQEDDSEATRFVRRIQIHAGQLLVKGFD